jgi:DNA-binding response OmpR family regulator
MIALVKKRSRIAVVDPNPSDYAAVAHGAGFLGLEFTFHREARSLLRDEKGEVPKLCLINMNLPDMSGLDLYDMLADRWPHVPIYLVGDDYRPDDEVKARASGATVYFCKPLEREWLTAAVAP